MEILIKETGRIAGKQALVYDKDSNTHFLLSSVKNDVVDKTFMVKCNQNCKVSNWNEVFVMIPSNHKRVLDMLENGMLTTKDFIFIEL